ncbi:MAG: phosphohydrolase [Gammaproteobacteria bacterium]|jgi:ABC-type uncharacterized transport system permease subunit|nr:phosphohydrolase [Gammaproteobacteria bacterium]
MITQLGLFATLAYAVAFMCQVASSKHLTWRFFLNLAIVIALICHGLQLHYLIDVPSGQNLAWTNLISLLAWLSALLIFVTNTVLPVAALNFLIFPTAIIAIGFSEVFHPVKIIVTQYHPQTLTHVLLATVIATLLVVCGLQAFLLMVQQFLLRRKKMLSLLELLPPLQIMERLLFFEILLCFLGLSIFLLTSLIGFNLSEIKTFWGETLFSLMLWFGLLILLLGRYAFRWRSATAASCSFVALAIGVLLYLSSHLT